MAKGLNPYIDYTGNTGHHIIPQSSLEGLITGLGWTNVDIKSGIVQDLTHVMGGRNYYLKKGLPPFKILTLTIIRQLGFQIKQNGNKIDLHSRNPIIEASRHRYLKDLEGEGYTFKHNLSPTEYTIPLFKTWYNGIKTKATGQVFTATEVLVIYHFFAWKAANVFNATPYRIESSSQNALDADAIMYYKKDHYDGLVKIYEGMKAANSNAKRLTVLQKYLNFKQDFISVKTVPDANFISMDDNKKVALRALYDILHTSIVYYSGTDNQTMSKSKFDKKGFLNSNYLKSSIKKILDDFSTNEVRKYGTNEKFIKIKKKTGQITVTKTDNSVFTVNLSGGRINLNTVTEVVEGLFS